MPGAFHLLFSDMSRFADYAADISLRYAIFTPPLLDARCHIELRAIYLSR